jgi:hypothetical protein
LHADRFLHVDHCVPSVAGAGPSRDGERSAA